MKQIDGLERADRSDRDVSDRWMRIFVAASATLSFTTAARLLGIGQPAVSHAIKRLEAAIGIQLFDRRAGRIELTSAGAELHRRALAGYDVVDRAIAEARTLARSDRTVTLSVSTALATYWLMPRLAAFKERHPDVELRVITHDTDAGVGRDGADLWIPLGPGPWPGLRNWVFAEEQLRAVASPAYLERVGPGAVKDGELLHLEERYGRRYDWMQWFADHDMATDRMQTGHRSNDYSIVVNAALEGQGVALGWLHIVNPLLASGRLVAIDDHVVRTRNPFHIVARPEASHREGVDALRHWLLAAATADSAEPPRRPTPRGRSQV